MIYLIKKKKENYKRKNDLINSNKKIYIFYSNKTKLLIKNLK